MSYPRITMPSLIPAIIYLAGLIVMCISAILFFITKNSGCFRRKAALTFLYTSFLFLLPFGYDAFYYTFVEKKPGYCVAIIQKTEEQNSGKKTFHEIAQIMDCLRWERNHALNLTISVLLSLVAVSLILSIHRKKLLKREPL